MTTFMNAALPEAATLGCTPNLGIGACGHSASGSGDPADYPRDGRAYSDLGKHGVYATYLPTFRRPVRSEIRSHLAARVCGLLGDRAHPWPGRSWHSRPG